MCSCGVGLGWVGVGWVGLVWVGLGWVGVRADLLAGASLRRPSTASLPAATSRSSRWCRWHCRPRWSRHCTSSSTCQRRHLPRRRWSGTECRWAPNLPVVYLLSNGFGITAMLGCHHTCPVLGPRRLCSVRMSPPSDPPRAPHVCGLLSPISRSLSAPSLSSLLSLSLSAGSVHPAGDQALCAPRLDRGTCPDRRPGATL